MKRMRAGDFVYCPKLGDKEAFYGIVGAFLSKSKNYGEQFEVKDVVNGTGWVRTPEECVPAFGPRNKS